MSGILAKEKETLIADDDQNLPQALEKQSRDQKVRKTRVVFSTERTD